MYLLKLAGVDKHAWSNIVQVQFGVFKQILVRLQYGKIQNHRCIGKSNVGILECTQSIVHFNGKERT